MERRQLIRGMPALAIPAITGCAEVGLGDVTGDSRTLDGAVEHRGVSVNPEVYMTTAEMKWKVSGDTKTNTATAPSGATFLFTHLTVEHVGENKRSFPSRGTFSGTRQDLIEMFYKEEKLSDFGFEDTARIYKINDKTFRSYIHVLLDEDLHSSVYEGKASGWLVNEIPEGFAPEEATVEITWGGETYEWTYSEDAEIIPKDVPEEYHDNNGSTINM